jgi:hypothetical protein
MTISLTNIIQQKPSAKHSWFEDPPRKNPEKLPDIIPFSVVHPNDYLPVTIIQPNLNNGPWIAGGAALSWYQGLPINEGDIDVFCKNPQQAKKLIDYIDNLELDFFNGYKTCVSKTDNAVTYHIELVNSKSSDNDYWKIQIITCKYFSSIQEVIDSFDITVCQVATCGYEWILGDKTAKDINDRNLRFNHLTKDSPKRLVKYWCYGYIPNTDTLESVQNNEVSNWDFSADEDYNNAF